MNKFILLSVVAMMSLSCTTENTGDKAKEREIDFRIAITRGTEITENNLASFETTALLPNGEGYFADVEYVKSGVYYRSYESYYWPSDGSDLEFYAWSPSKSKLGGTLYFDKESRCLLDFKPSENIDSQTDFISAYTPSSYSTSASGVELNFQHNLAQIEIRAKSEHEGYVHKVKGVGFANLYASGDFDFDTREWTTTDDKTFYITEYNTPKVLSSQSVTLMNGEGNNAMVIPQAFQAWDCTFDKTNTKRGVYLGVKIQICTKEGTRIYPLRGDYDWMAIPIGGEFEAGKKYIYTINYTAGSGWVYPDKPQPADGDYDVFGPGDVIYGLPITIIPTIKNIN